MKIIPLIPSTCLQLNRRANIQTKSSSYVIHPGFTAKGKPMLMMYGGCMHSLNKVHTI